MEVINADLIVFDDTTDDQLVDSVGDGFLLVLSLPEEAFHLDGEDLLEQSVEVSLSFVRLYVEENE